MRFSFRAKLLSALVAAVGVVLATTLVIIRQQTRAQVRLVTQQVTQQSRNAFEQIEQVQRTQLAALSSAFTESPRTRAALEAALESNDVAWLAETLRYEMELRHVSGALAAFTNPLGEPVATLIDGAQTGTDAAHIQPLVQQLMEQESGALLLYRVVGERLFLLHIQAVFLADHPIGTVTFGLPVDDVAAQQLANVVGAEMCFVADARCIAGTLPARQELAQLMIARAGQRSSALVRRAGARWLLLSDPVSLTQPSDGWRVMAVPMDATLAPFDRIQRALLFAGFGALFLAVLLGIILSRGLSRPVRQLVAATQQVGRGDYTTKVRVSSRDELGTLAESFNAMVDGLRLKELYRGVLDKVMSRAVTEDLLKGEIKLGGENREVTTVFADVSGFTPLVEGMEPQRVIALLNECMTRLERAVQAEAGVVDKFIGDEVMAIFGAPVAGPDDAQRAVRAALRMQLAMRELNQERAGRGERAVEISVGVHTGVAVAGNMGSPNRLNYTVLGEAVNLAARLCKAAGPGEILASVTTWQRVQRELLEEATADAAGTRVLKGFSKPIEVVSLRARTEQPSSAGASAARALLLGLALLTAASPARAQRAEGGLPTLDELGVRWSSASGAVQLAWSGRLDLEGYVPQETPAWLIPTTSSFVAGRLRLFTDVFLGDRVYAMAELRADRGAAPQAGDLDARLEQVFLRVRPVRVVALQAGKFAHPFGGYAQRHLSSADPFIRPPLNHDYRTIVAPRFAPGGLAGFLDWKDAPALRRPRGAPIVWDVPYPWGVLLALGAGKVSTRAALIGSAPSSGPDDWSLEERRLRHPAAVIGANVQLTPELMLGVSGSRGPYLEPLTEGVLPAGTQLEDFVQEILGFEMSVQRGHVTVRAEAFINRWQVPNLSDDPRDISCYVEPALRLAPGWFVAARYGAIHFNRMRAAASSAEERWDFNQQRLQLGSGYRIVPNVELRGEYMLNHTSGTTDPHDNLLAVQLWWAF